jgi:TatD DNase family protein
MDTCQRSIVRPAFVWYVVFASSSIPCDWLMPLSSATMNNIEKLDVIDTHAHLDIAPLAADRAAVVERARAAGVSQVLTVGIDADSSRRAVEICSGFPGVFAAVGVHPHEARAASDALLSHLAKLAEHPRVVAWGEIGLDFVLGSSPRDVQVQAFERQLALAQGLGLPVIIHDRDAHAEVLDVLDAGYQRGLRGVVHCFSGDRDMVRKILDLGLFVSVTGIVTFPKAEVLREVVRYVPLSCLLIETDSPYLSPVPYRGRANEPAMVVHVLREVARVKGITVEEVARCTSANARGLFGLPRA